MNTIYTLNRNYRFSWAFQRRLLAAGSLEVSQIKWIPLVESLIWDILKQTGEGASLLLNIQPHNRTGVERPEITTPTCSHSCCRATSGVASGWLWKCLSCLSCVPLDRKGMKMNHLEKHITWAKTKHSPERNPPLLLGWVLPFHFSPVSVS